MPKDFMTGTGRIAKTRDSQLTKNKMSHDARNLVQTSRALFLGLIVVAFVPAGAAEHYRGRPFHDSVYHGGPQKIPGRVQCAYYDLGGEGGAYHDTDKKNKGRRTI